MLVKSCGAVAENRYLELGLEHVAASHVLQATVKALRLGAVAVLASTALALLCRLVLPRARWLALALFSQLCFAVAYLVVGRSSHAYTERWGWLIPSDLGRIVRIFQWRRELDPFLAGAAAVWLLGTAWILWRGRRTGRDAPFAGRVLGIAPVVALAFALLAPVALWMWTGSTRPGPRASELPHVVLFTWDSLRADRLSCYGHDRETSPNLDRLASGSILFEQAVSQHNWTQPSYATMLTGRYRWQFEGLRFGRAQVTLPEILKEQGYRTLGFVQNPQLDAHFTFDQGFDFYLQMDLRPRPEDLNAEVIRQVESVASAGSPLFLFVHYVRPHFPYPEDNPYHERFASQPPLESDETMAIMGTHGRGFDPEDPARRDHPARLLDAYDATIRHTDERFGELYRELDRLLDLERAVVVFHSDHGDEFFEHGGFGHGHQNVFQELLHVPLLLRFPQASRPAPRRVAEPVMLLDLVPTLLDFLGLESPVPMTGQSLLPLLDGEVPDRVFVSHVNRLVAVRRGSWKLIVDYEDGTADRLHDLAADPEEERPLEQPESHRAYALLRSYAEQWLLDFEASGAGEVVRVDEHADEELRRRLQALGYTE